MGGLRSRMAQAKTQDPIQGTGSMAQVGKCVPSKSEALSLNSSTTKKKSVLVSPPGDSDVA
jgi:hypothetical protein